MCFIQCCISVSRFQSQMPFSLTLKNPQPNYDTPEDIEFFKTLIVGYPSGDKRVAFIQMEAITGFAAKDEWDFKYLGKMKSCSFVCLAFRITIRHT